MTEKEFDWVKYASEMGIDLSEYRITVNGLVLVESRTKLHKNPRKPRGHGGYKYTDDPNANKPGGGSNSSHGSGTRNDG